MTHREAKSLKSNALPPILKNSKPNTTTTSQDLKPSHHRVGFAESPPNLDETNGSAAGSLSEIPLEGRDGVRNKAKGLKRAGKRDIDQVLSWEYIHDVFYHCNNPRKLWETLKRCVGVTPPDKPPDRISCTACMKHKTPRSNYSHLNQAQKEANKQRLDAEKQKIEQENDERLLAEYEAYNTTGVWEAESHSDSQSNETSELDIIQVIPELLEESDSDIDDETDTWNEQADHEITEKWYEYLDAIQNGDDERVRLEKVYKEAVEKKIQLQRIPTVPRFEGARPLEHIFCDLKTYKQKVYGHRAGEMMFTDFKSQLWDVEAVTANKHSCLLYTSPSPRD